MAGINFSSSVSEKSAKKGRIFDGSFVVITILFFLVLAGFGGLRWYLKTLDAKAASLSAAFGERSAQLKGSGVDRVANFESRLALAGEQLADQRVDPQELFGQLERLTLPNVKLTKYGYNAKEKFVEVAGETESFKYVAQQIISLKSEDLFSGITVQSLTRTKEGSIQFSFKATFN